jgi:hypothetical protein
VGFASFPRHNAGFYPIPLFWDPFFYDDLSASGYPLAAEPPVIIMQAPATAADSTPVPPSSPAQPLLIELRGNRYVRISGEETSGAELIDQAPAAPRQRENSSVANPVTPVQELAPVVLVFRDGHCEQVSEYTIADGVLYTAANYYTDGAWNRKIELSSLDLPETVKSNQSRGVRFQLPAFPNEVIVRP